jgi:hypothetical protein
MNDNEKSHGSEGTAGAPMEREIAGLTSLERNIRERGTEEEVVLGAGNWELEAETEKMEMRPLEMKAFEPRINGDTEVRFEPVVPWPENGLFLASCSMNLKA